MQNYNNFDPIGCTASEKLDGINAAWDGKTLTSRNGNTFTPPRWFLNQLPSEPCTGELWTRRSDFETALSIVSKNVPIDSEWAQIKFLIFDLPHVSTEHTASVTKIKISDEKHLESFYQSVLTAGGEGVVIEKDGECYKRKPLTDDDARVTGYTPHSKHDHLIGALRVRDKNGLEFKIGIGLKKTDRECPPEIGEIITFSLRGRTKKGKPRFASYTGVRYESDFV